MRGPRRNSHRPFNDVQNRLLLVFEHVLDRVTTVWTRFEHRKADLAFGKHEITTRCPDSAFQTNTNI